VKIGQKNSIIEIELHDADGEGNNAVIERHFSVDGDSRFYLNGKQISSEKLEKIVRNFRIQIDNLCQILPQEKVEMFAKMNDHERLSGTLKTVGNHDLSEHLEFLKNSKEQEVVIQRKLVGLKDRLVEMRSKQHAMEIEVKTVYEKRSLINCLKLIKQRREWQIYFHLKQAVNLINDAIQSKRNASKKLIGILKSTLAEVKSSSVDVEKAKEKASETNIKVTSIVRDVKKKQNEIAVMTEKISDVKSSFRQTEQRFKSQENDMKTLKAKIEKTKNEITNCSQADCERDALKVQLGKQERENHESVNAKERASYTLSAKRSEMNAYSCKLKKMNDVNAQKERILEQYHEDCYRGLKWLEKNRNLFRGEVYGPMFLYLNVDDSQNAKFVEQSIAQRDLIAFMCELREDTNTLIKELREKLNLRISVVVALSDASSYDTRAPYPIENLKSLGFRCYVDSLISGPPIVVNYLTVTYKLYRIPIGNAHTYNVVSDVPTDIDVFFTDEYRFESKVVKLTGEKIESSREIMEPRYLATNVNASAKQELQANMQQCERELRQLEDEFKKLSDQVATGDNEARQIRGEMKKLEAIKMAEKRLQETLRTSQRELNRIQSAAINLTVEKNKCRLEVKLILAKVTNMYIELGDAFKTLYETFITYQQDRINVEQHKMIHAKNVNTTAEFVKALKKEAGLVCNLEAKKRKVINFANYFYKYAMNCTRGADPRTRHFSQRKMFFKLTDNIVLLNRLMNTFQAKVNCLGNGMDDLKLLKEYEELVRNVNRIEKKIVKNEEILQTHFSRVDKIKQNFSVQVKDLIATIDKNFCKFFEMMGCVGTVCLYEGEPGNDDFNKYGIHIKVKFRKEGELHILNSQIQSGGERAVSIAIYLLSLQELTAVPFRCIDEINQGMDADNERRIFNLITQVTEERGNTQYFLLTPKLLPNLNFPEQCKIFFPFNGVGSMPHERYSEL
jgi:chromosome segregation ATPase